MDVVDVEGVERTQVEQAHTRALTTMVGEVEVARQAYRARGKANLHRADADLNLPLEQYSHGLRKEAARGSYEAVPETIQRQTGVQIGKRQIDKHLRRATPKWILARLLILLPGWRVSWGGPVQEARGRR